MLALQQKRRIVKVSGQIVGILQGPVMFLIWSFVAATVYAAFVSLPHAIAMLDAFVDGLMVSGYGAVFAYGVVVLFTVYGLAALPYLIFSLLTRCKNCKHNLVQHEDSTGQAYIHCRGPAAGQKSRLFPKMNTCPCQHFEG